jgi:glyoxylate/hydroxypyruvate reductase
MWLVSTTLPCLHAALPWLRCPVLSCAVLWPASATSWQCERKKTRAGHIGAAVLDVFEKEPLPSDSRLWTHPAVRITPHISSITNRATAVEQIASNYCKAERGEPMQNLVDVQAGY